MTTATFDTLGLAEPLMRALRAADYHTPTPIQAQALPPLLAGRDLLGLAETGSGKTAAFVLPMLQRLAADRRPAEPRSTRALVLAPTRELAIQIGESIATYGRHMGLSHTVIFGGVGQRPQVQALARGVDILVATPGRLLDLCDQRLLRLGSVSILVLDEADRMLDMGFIRDVRRILKMVPAKRQSLLFSATMPNDIAQLAGDLLADPVRVEIARAGKTVDRIEQRVIHVSSSAKRGALAGLLADPELKRVIVFTRTKRGADRVCRAIESLGIAVHSIHGNKSQGQRQSALDSFRKGYTRVLVATDIAARGIDIDEITHVINYELPNIPESYVHRIGRTARAGAEGIAIALCAPDERPYLADIERLTGRRLAVIPAPAGVAGAAGADEDDSERRQPRRKSSNSRHGAERREKRGERGARHGAPPYRDDERRERRPRQGRDDRQPDRAADGAGGRAGEQPSQQRSRSGDHGRPRHHEPRSRAEGAPADNGRDRRPAGRPGTDQHRRDGKNPGGHSARNGSARPQQGRSDAERSAGDRREPQPWRNWTRSDEAARRSR